MPDKAHLGSYEQEYKQLYKLWRKLTKKPMPPRDVATARACIIALEHEHLPERLAKLVNRLREEID